MALKRVPPLKDPVDQVDEYVVPPGSRWKGIALGLGLVLMVAGLWWMIRSPSVSPDTHVTPVPALDGPSIQLKPSLVVPGPGQQPHPATEGTVARPDEVIIFRVDVTEPGYVLVGVENPDGRLVRLFGGRPDDKPVKGSELLYEDGLVLAYALERHKGQSVTFVTALSSSRWETIPERVPASPRRHPPTEGIKDEESAALFRAWDRFTLQVAEQVPVFGAPVQSE